MSSVLSNPAGGAAAPMARKLGRYELHTLLGKSGRSMLWLAHDLRAGGEPLWLTLPRQQPAEGDARARWLHRAQLAARITHPQLLPVLSVDDQERWPLVASSAPAGGTLEQRLGDTGAELVPVAQAVGWICELLQGLAVVHDAGLAHGDIGAHCVALDADGHVRLAGLGGSLPADDDGAGAAPSNARAVDTGALRSQRGAAERDLLACGLLLHRLIAGAHALDERDVDRVIDRLEEREIVRLGFNLPQQVPDALRAIVNRATEREPQRRFLSARSLQRALQGWLDAQAEGAGPLALLLDRLASVGHLPALPGLLTRVGKVAGMEQQGLADMAEVLLQDPALVFELLRHVHAAQFASAGERRVATVRRAVQLIGLQGLRRAATALRPWPGALAEQHCSALAAAVREARLAAHMARILCPADMDGEAAYLVALLQQLGGLLARYHFAEEAEQIARLVQPDSDDTPGMESTAAACAVLGVDLDSLGQAVARHWGLGETLQQAMRRVPLDAAVRAPELREDMLRLLASAACEAVAAAALPPGKPRAGTAKAQSPFARVMQRYARALHLGSTELAEAYAQARRAVDGEPPPERADTSAQRTP